VNKADNDGGTLFKNTTQKLGTFWLLLCIKNKHRNLN